MANTVRTDTTATDTIGTNTIETSTTKVAKQAAGIGISLDSWAVALALFFVLLVWAGWIKTVPW